MKGNGFSALGPTASSKQAVSRWMPPVPYGTAVGLGSLPSAALSSMEAGQNIPRFAVGRKALNPKALSTVSPTKTHQLFGRRALNKNVRFSFGRGGWRWSGLRRVDGNETF